MVEAITKMHPSTTLVAEKLFKAWCMAPIKRKSRKVAESFRQGKMAEPLIHNNIQSFVSENTSALIKIVHLTTVGMTRSSDDGISAVSPDGVGVLQFSLLDDIEDARTVEEKDVVKLKKFFEVASNNTNTLLKDESEGGIWKLVMVALEYKHKSQPATIAKNQSIVSTVLNGRCVVVLNLGHEEDRTIFQKSIPNIDYRCQVLHELVVCSVGCVMYICASTRIDFALIILLPNTIVESYVALMKYSQESHFEWLYEEGSAMARYDRDLTRMPDFKGISNWGYAGDRDTVKCRLQLMMALFELRQELGKPLEACTYLLPKVIPRWNIEKGGVDDMSQVLAHVLNWCGPINPLQVMWMRVTFVCLYNDWRLHELIETHEYLLSEECTSFYKYQDKRQKVGKPFVDFLCSAFDALKVPAELNKGDSPRKRSDGVSREPVAETADAVEWQFRTAKHISRFGKSYHAQRTASTCSLCHVPLCSEPPAPQEQGAGLCPLPQMSCFERWHTCREIMP